MKDLVYVYITNPSKEKAKEIAKILLEKRLIGCANIFAINSLYWWNKKIVDEEEHVLIGKTTEEKFLIVKNEVESIHPYTIPCIIKIPVKANDEYSNWILAELI